MRAILINRGSKRKLAWLSASLGAAAVAGVVLRLRRYRRKLEAEAARLSEALNLKPGAMVAEVGAGKGQLTLLLAQQVGPSGRVLSTEFEPKKLRKISRSVQKHGVENVTILQGSQTGSELPPESCDAIFMRGVYHHLTAPQEMNRNLFRALRPGGMLAVIDFPPRLLLSLWMPKGIPDNRGGHGIRKQLLEEEVTLVGFQRMREYDDWPSRLYCVVFRKPAA